MCSPMTLAERYCPKGIPRFIGIILAFPCMLVTVVPALPLLMVAVIVGMWEVANEDNT